MTVISLTATNLVQGLNSLKLWNAGAEVGSITRIRVYANSDIIQLQDDIDVAYNNNTVTTQTKTDEGVIAAKDYTEGWSTEGADITGDNDAKDVINVGGTPVADVVFDLATAKEEAAKAKLSIEDMASDSVLSVVEKTAWNAQWKTLHAEYLTLKSRASALGQSYSVMLNAHDDLFDYLYYTADVWSDPNTPYNLVGTIMVDLVTDYYEAYADLVGECADKKTEGWSEEGADITGENTAEDVSKIGGTPVATVVTDISTAKTNATAATTSIADMASDNKLSVEEKATWRRQWPSFDSNYSIYASQASTLGVSITTLYNAKESLESYLISEGVWSRTTSSDSIVGSTMVAKLATYYDALEDFLIACSDKKTETWADKDADVTNYYDTRISNAAIDAMTEAEVATAIANDETVIDGARITTGIVLAARIDLAGLKTNLEVGALHFTDAGEISFGSYNNRIYGYSTGLSLEASGSQQVNVKTTEIRISSMGYSNSKIDMIANGPIVIGSYNSDTTIGGANIGLNPQTSGSLNIKFGTTNKVYVSNSGFVPNSSNNMLLGNTSQYWSACYATAYYDNGGGYNDTMDDLAILSQYKPRKIKVIDKVSKEEKIVTEKHPDTGHEFIDKNTLPDWMLNKDAIKQKLKDDCGCMITDTDIEEWILDHEEAGWMVGRDISKFNDLTNGAVRQLDTEVLEMFEMMSHRITLLETALAKLQ